MKYAEVAIALPMDRIFHYAIPNRLQEEIAVGKRVFVPFQTRTKVGYVTGFTDKTDVSDVKEIFAVIDKEPIILEEMLHLTKWIKDNYFCSWGEAIEAVIPQGIKKGILDIGHRIKDHKSCPDFAKSNPHALTHEQRIALKAISDSIENNEFITVLLHGITASGKTEVYLQSIERVLAKNKQAIILVPEISLTPQTVERFASRFPDRVAVLHSKLSPAKRFLEWKRIKEGKADIVVGARSAVFSPTSRLGLIIVDEEHENTYKQDDVPRYHARDVAEERARINKCPLILGTATPSLEAYYKALNGEYKLIRLTKRIDERLLPKVKIVDMRMELATRKRITIFSKILLDSIEKTLKGHKQAIIFLNRRGFSTFINCKKCGYVVKCKYCDSSMVYHFDSKKLVCHLCDRRIEPPEICPNCKAGYISYFGLGTEKVESEIARNFPGASLARMDSDTTQKSGSHDRILGDFKSGGVRLLVGTQMIAKGLDFPQVTLVGVISADVSLNIPDFRASERTFNLLTQVAGRAGRGEDGGEVIVQTYVPSHYAILAASKHNYEKFYEEEIVLRKELGFPPYVHLAKVIVRARNAEIASSTVSELAARIKTADKDVKFMGPAQAPIFKMRGYFRFNIILKGKDRISMSKLLREVLGSFKKPYGVLIAVDIDPVNM